jgi:hypothetical protein
MGRPSKPAARAIPAIARHFDMATPSFLLPLRVLG